MSDIKFHIEQSSLWDNCSAFGGETCDAIISHIKAIVDMPEKVELKVSKTVSSIYFFSTLVFRIRINSKAQYLETEIENAQKYIPEIKGAFAKKDSFCFPLTTDSSSLPHADALLCDLFDYCFKLVRVEPFGCCNDHVKCSDAKKCLHEKELFYQGCMYRKNLEAGRIFYGKNRNIDTNNVNMTDRRYVIIDVETPNSSNNRISALGLAVVEHGQIIDEFYTLINPEACFCDFNIRLTGITPDMVKDKPTFAQIWPKIFPYLTSGLIVAHNASFDVRVLAKCIQAYQLDFSPYTEYICTCEMARQIMSQSENHRLDTVCNLLNITLENHHCALNDARACANILIHFLSMGTNTEDYVKCFDNQNLCQYKTTGKAIHISEESQQLLQLKDLLQDISANGILSSEELQALQEWLDENQIMQNHYPFNKIFSTIQNVMQDGIMDAEENTQLLLLFNKILDPVNQSCDCECFDISGKIFCLTGDFEAGSRQAVEAYFVQNGGIAAGNVTKKTQYLIVGKNGSEHWSAGNYGGKIKKALQLQEKGCSIKIIKEENITISL